ncbi:MAG: DUF4363 family protein [Oscillospiraceae bacterium]|nr:DUF4363 family protein [Oscillospiraceae bacterium]
MKRIILCIILFIALCALAAGSYFYIVGTTTRLLNKVEFVSKSYSDGEFHAAYTAAREADELWAEFRKRRHLIIDRDNVAEITSGLARIKSIAGDSSESGKADRELIHEAAATTALLRQYYNKQQINLYNIL